MAEVIDDALIVDVQHWVQNSGTCANNTEISIAVILSLVMSLSGTASTGIDRKYEAGASMDKQYRDKEQQRMLHFDRPTGPYHRIQLKTLCTSGWPRITC
ncbi:MAG: hypothetical protein L0Z73_01750 [Gammaproteobacteria bacterium]|nr:hypothetical protein [Gammaproteobacteria bacterium]